MSAGNLGEKSPFFGWRTTSPQDFLMLARRWLCTSAYFLEKINLSMHVIDIWRCGCSASQRNAEVIVLGSASDLSLSDYRGREPTDDVGGPPAPAAANPPICGPCAGEAAGGNARLAHGRSIA